MAIQNTTRVGLKTHTGTARPNPEQIVTMFERTIRRIREIESMMGDLQKELATLRIRARIEAVNDLGPYQSLTMREKQVLSLVLNNKLNKEIAGELNITTRTVKFHVAKLFVKFGGVKSRHELAMACVPKK